MYQKYKDRKPEDTLFEIQRILYEVGISTTYEFVKHEISNLYSNRVTIGNTTLGTNGKGTTKPYALASAYGELMERLQNNMLYIGMHNPKLFHETGFRITADEKWMLAENYIEKENVFLDYVFEQNQCNSILDKFMLLKKWCNWDKDKVVGIPFYCIKELTDSSDFYKKNKIEYLPYQIYSTMYGSNGMCAGNTPEEALVQGLSEIYERYVMRCLLSYEITPPDVPEEYLQKYPKLYDTIQFIRQNYNYMVIVKDLSLGRGYPVIGTIILNRKGRTFGFRLAAHPSFEVALERTLTEAMQGRKLESFITTSEIGSEEQASSQNNIANLFKCGMGYYRRELFYKEASYSFVPYTDKKNMTNKELLFEMMTPFIREGYSVFIRDVGYLGFPAYHIIIPKISEMYSGTDMRRKEIATLQKISQKLMMSEQVTKEDAKRLIRYIEYNRGNKGTNQFSWLLKRPFAKSFYGGVHEVSFLLTAAYYFVGDLENAIRVLECIIQSMKKEKNVYLNETEAIFQYLMLLYQGESKEHALDIITVLFDETISEKILHIWGEANIIFQKLYPVLNCWNCENCSLWEKEICCYPEIYELYNNLAKIQKKNQKQQEGIKNIFIVD